MTNDTLANALLSVSVTPHGAELCSLRGGDGIEYLWQADPKVWASHAPVLFPVIGRLADDRYTLAGQVFAMKKHGFARNSDFERVGQTDTALTYRLQASSATLDQYPFNFTFLRQFMLKGDTLEIHNDVTNHSPGVMPFSIGEHPGFSLAWGSGDKIEDYYLEFEKAETLDSYRLDDRMLLSRRNERILTDERVLALRRDLFDQDALIFLRMNSESVSLCSARHKRRLTVEFPGYPNLGIWAKPGAPYVCIEPWYGYADTSDHDGDLMTKPGIILLQPGRSFSCVSRVLIHR